ncbi:hypothetical protein RB195_003147 [Necator americanus]|uniref:Transporter, major facilitator family protein n=1 Tax=Necator americanus TaxID=51031 RepID=A0ABR1DMV0_NECAM
MEVLLHDSRAIVVMLDFLRKNIGMEIPLFLYMLTSFLKFPVFQNLMYEKVCLARHNQDFTFCSNVTAYHNDKTIQADANHFYFLSSVVLVLPSLFSTLALGAATTLSYGVKTTSTSRRSVRIAGMEGAIGLGGTIGYATSGIIREALGYSYTFLLMLVLQVIAFFYILIFAKDVEKFASQDEDRSRGPLSRIVEKSLTVIADYWRLLTTERKFRLMLVMNLLALGVELLIFAGLMDIQYSYLRFKLGWGDKQYGWFSGLQYGVTTASVLILYPFLYIRGMSDGILGCLGLTAKMISLIMLAFVLNSAMAFSVIVFTSLNRFVATGFRSFISGLIQTNEQGKMFSLIALLEGVTGLLASAIYNNLYPKTLSFFPGLFHLLSAALLIIPLTILGISDLRVKASSELENDNESTTAGTLN